MAGRATTAGRSRAASGSGLRYRLITGVLVLLVLFGLAFMGVAWYYAGQIESGALRVDREPHKRELRVESITQSPAEIRLVRIAGDTHLDDPGTFGLEGPRGFGLIRDIKFGGESEVIRSFEIVQGTIDPGDLVRIDKAAFPGDPGTAHGLIFETVRLKAEIGDLPAWYVPGKDDTWAIMVHGRRGEKQEALRALRTVAGAGLPALVLGYRNDDGVPEDPSGYYQFGLTEWKDVEAGVQYAVDHGATDIVLVGFSMGGGIVASFMYQSPLADRVVGLVLDSPMLDFSQTIDLAARDRNLPGVVADAAKWIASIRYNVDWKALDYLDRVGQLQDPVLLFHGDADETVPISISEEFALRRSDIVTYVPFKDATHVGSWNVDPARYESALSRYLTTAASQ
ncbi:MAG: alpha/beta hydrolase [Chloroflexi bacterium]|nr:alpha/beta hydrolase [Chloroflexota bacterium]